MRRAPERARRALTLRSTRLADAEAAFRGALAIAEAALGRRIPQLSGSMTALADVAPSGRTSREPRSSIGVRSPSSRRRTARRTRE